MRAMGVLSAWIVGLGVALVASAAACGRTNSEPSTGVQGQGQASGVDAVGRYFPLEEGKIYHYVTRENGETGMLVAKVHRTDAAHAELRLSNATRRFVFTAAGVAYDEGAFILKAPLDVGASWSGEHGGTTRVAKTDAWVEVPAGRYAGCVETVEEGGRPTGAIYSTTYCAGIGMVKLEVKAAGGEASAELKSYGLPAKIE